MRVVCFVQAALYLIAMLSDKIRRLPQGCQLESEHTDEEWMRFVTCARETFDGAEHFHKEFYAKIDYHEVTDHQVRRTIRRSAKLAAYSHGGRSRLALWDNSTRAFVIMTIEGEGSFFSAFTVQDLEDYLGSESISELRWLRR
jgi:hypothetical protein